MKKLIFIPVFLIVLAAGYGAADAYRDRTAPTVTVFSIPSTYGELTVPISAFAATDNAGVTGYLVTQTSTQPRASASGWTRTPTASYTFSSAGAKTLYAWAKDAAGNVSTSKSASVTITLGSTGGAGSGGGAGGGTGSGTTGISGIVLDIVTGSAISGAAISDGTNSTTTGSNGGYTLNEAAGSYTLTISKSGYLTTYQAAAVTSGLTTTVNWALTKSYGTQKIPAAGMNYVILAWNDLGMHCDQNDYSYFMVLPPFNTLHAQVFQRGGEGASVVTSGITVSYSFQKKTNSALHTNFWDYAPQYGYSVPTNVGITGTPLAGNMTVDAKSLGWEAVGIPITPYD
ncbi:MAG: carboxypeptidase-like regulatory domain-containing protein, partial [Nitrospiraceae bacterium]|nr:carboxypeptidase-like regulatory domain-containing protein [Nitrospiraceae bacterium]